VGHAKADRKRLNAKVAGTNGASEKYWTFLNNCNSSYFFWSRQDAGQATLTGPFYPQLPVTQPIAYQIRPPAQFPARLALQLGPVAGLVIGH
jgi:hypothetical protein